MTTNINLPKGPGSWPDQEKSQRSETYKDLLDLKGGTYKAGRDNLAANILKEVSDPARKYEYWDVISMTEKSTMPVSTVIQNAFKQGGESKPKELMQYSLDYLVNGEENKGGNFNKGKEVNIDRVVRGDLVFIKLDPATNRWILEVFDQSLKDIKDGEKSEQYLKMKGFLFPPSRFQTSSTGPEVIPNKNETSPVSDENLSLTIQEILPAFGQYLSVNPRTHWYDYSEAFYQLPEDRQTEIQSKIEVELNNYIQNSISGGLQASINRETNPEKKSLLEAVQQLQTSTEAASLESAREKLRYAGKEGSDMLKDMNHDLERARQSQLLAMFDAIVNSEHEAVADDWAIMNKTWMGLGEDRDYLKDSKEKMNLVRKISPLIQEVFAKNEKLATLDEVVDKLKKEPASRPSTVSEGEIDSFKKFWEEFKGKEGKEVLSADISKDDFMEDMSVKMQAEWLNLAIKMRDEGQTEQAEQILRSILTGHKPGAGNLPIKDFIEKELSQPEKDEILAELNRSVRDDYILKNLEEQGILSDTGLESAGAFNSVTGKYLDPTSGKEVSRTQAVNAMVALVKKQTVEIAAEKQYFFKATEDGHLDGIQWTDFEKKAFDIYADMEGAGYDLSDSTNQMFKEEILMSVAILGLSATGVGLLGVGARVASLGRGARALSVAARVGEMATSANRITRWSGRALQTGGRVGMAALPLAADGFVFHNVHAALSTPIVGANAWDEYGTGVAHSMGMYMIFGAGNHYWNRGMRALETRYAGNAVGNFAGRAQVGSIREAFGTGGLRGVGYTVLAKQPAMFTESLALTGMTHAMDGGIEDGNFYENLGKNWVTLNLLWGMQRGRTREDGAPKIEEPATRPEPTPEPAREPVAEGTKPTEQPAVEPNTTPSEPAREPAAEVTKPTEPITEPVARAERVRSKLDRIPSSRTELENVMREGRSAELIELMQRDMGSILGRGFDQGGKAKMADLIQLPNAKAQLIKELSAFLKLPAEARGFNERDHLDASELLTEFRVNQRDIADPDASRIINVMRDALDVLQGGPHDVPATVTGDR